MNKSDQMRTGERRMPESSLTGLQLPAAFMESAGNFIKRIEPDTYCFVAIDIIYFRMINKICGRSGGDKLLRRIADCLEKFRMLYDGVTGYFEGDDFCIIMPWKMELVKQLMKDIRREIEALGVTIGVIPFFGVSVINDTGLPPEVYCDRATLALSKATGRCRISMYDPKMENQLEEDMNLLAEIIKGIEQNEFVFYVQPQCDISTGRIVGAESLVRWQSKKNGLVMPGRFIPLLERIGMIYILDRQIWEKVCQWLTLAWGFGGRHERIKRKYDEKNRKEENDSIAACFIIGRSGDLCIDIALGQTLAWGFGFCPRGRTL